MLRVIIGGAVVALLVAFMLNGSREARHASAPERVTGALEAQRREGEPLRVRDERAPAAAGEAALALQHRGAEGSHRVDAGVDR